MRVPESFDHADTQIEVVLDAPVLGERTATIALGDLDATSTD